MHEAPTTNNPEIIEKTEKPPNPNSIGELMSVGTDIPTSPDKVYRGVLGDGAITDLEESGVVRNAHSAGLRESRWGERVFWNRGATGKFQNIQEGGYVIEAPLAVASERQVTKEDVTAIYKKNERGEVVDTLQEKKLAQESSEQSLQIQREQKRDEELSDVRKKLGLESE